MLKAKQYNKSIEQVKVGDMVKLKGCEKFLPCTFFDNSYLSTYRVRVDCTNAGIPEFLQDCFANWPNVTVDNKSFEWSFRYVDAVPEDICDSKLRYYTDCNGRMFSCKDGEWKLVNVDKSYTRDQLAEEYGSTMPLTEVELKVLK